MLSNNKKSIKSNINDTFDNLSKKIDDMYVIECRSGNEGIPYADREDFAIDKDKRIIEYDKLLLNMGFKYLYTTMGRYGGTRNYSNSIITVGVVRWENDIQWYINRTSDGKPIADGKGLQLLISKVEKSK